MCSPNSNCPPDTTSWYCGGACHKRSNSQLSQSSTAAFTAGLLSLGANIVMLPSTCAVDVITAGGICKEDNDMSSHVADWAGRIEIAGACRVELRA